VREWLFWGSRTAAPDRPAKVGSGPFSSVSEVMSFTESPQCSNERDHRLSHNQRLRLRLAE